MGGVSGLDARLRDVVGGKTAAQLADRLDLHTVGDLLLHVPRRYAERGFLTDLSALREGELATVLARVLTSVTHDHGWKTTKHGAKRRLLRTEVVVTDGTAQLSLTFFNQPWRSKQLTVGRVALFAGKVGAFRGHNQLANPEVQLLDGEAGEEGVDALIFAGSLIPVYPVAGELPTWAITRSVRLALHALELTDREDPVPRELRQRHDLPTLREAFDLVHTPDTRADVTRGRRRLAWGEALVVQVALAQRRRAADAVAAVPRPPRAGGLLAAFDAALPFARTGGQITVGDEVARDLATPHPMHRLLQGEVGTGKTLVALRGMLQVVDAGGQAALMAPTEVLAAQHVRALRDLLGPLAIGGELGAAEGATRVALLTGSQGPAARKSALDEIARGDAGIVVGTHALLELTVQWHDLGMVVVDEQHRFGVEQRDALRANGVATGAAPHVLVMTATPIPRTVAMTVFGDLELSSLTELPLGRQPITTSLVPPERPDWLARVWQRVREEVAAGHQAFVVCPRIEAGDAAGDGGAEEGGAGEGPVRADRDDSGGDGQATLLDVEQARPLPRGPGAAVADMLPLLRDGELRGLRIAALHGRLPGDEKDLVMTAFARGHLDVLVATTVIEVGVDVPNATVMVVLDAERFGVSQLHQLRGRIGRGSAASVCLLQTSAAQGSAGRERLVAVASTTDGAELARLDLAQRREGDVLGAVQSGRRRRLRFLDLLRDEDVIRAARDEATALVARDPDLEVHPALAAALTAALREEEAAFLEKG